MTGRLEFEDALRTGSTALVGSCRIGVRIKPEVNMGGAGELTPSRLSKEVRIGSGE